MSTKTMLIIGAVAVGGYVIYSALQQGQQVSDAAGSVGRIADKIGGVWDTITGWFGGASNSIGAQPASNVGGDVYDGYHDNHPGYY